MPEDVEPPEDGPLIDAVTDQPDTKRFLADAKTMFDLVGRFHLQVSVLFHEVRLAELTALPPEPAPSDGPGGPALVSFSRSEDWYADVLASQTQILGLEKVDFASLRVDGGTADVRLLRPLIGSIDDRWTPPEGYEAYYVTVFLGLPAFCAALSLWGSKDEDSRPDEACGPFDWCGVRLRADVDTDEMLVVAYDFNTGERLYLEDYYLPAALTDGPSVLAGNYQRRRSEGWTVEDAMSAG
ncbi:hypothetical protein [Phycicoccus sp. Root101]|uniref:hypothetical protein n=1 Tax=Phycicoccus sp. Root101 TaxID=1736421 RepID=UPI000702B944|nr:hypothetical protein [Phycicoccus sp. Root101]KQU68307.1 hypothetical protein ASC58_12220 [Phycicoccus sp. Root101]